MNPLPALMVLLLGIMMSSHHQSSMVSTMIHQQWGTLLMGASFARGLTYIIFYLSPPTSFLPSRPPSELVTAFCLMAGGLVFMASVCVPTLAIYVSMRGYLTSITEPRYGFIDGVEQFGCHVCIHHNNGSC